WQEKRCSRRSRAETRETGTLWFLRLSRRKPALRSATSQMTGCCEQRAYTDFRKKGKGRREHSVEPAWSVCEGGMVATLARGFRSDRHRIHPVYLADVLHHLVGECDVRGRDVGLQLFHRCGADDDGGNEGSCQAEG